LLDLNNEEADSFTIFTICSSRDDLWYISKFLLCVQLYVCMLLMMESGYFSTDFFKFMYFHTTKDYNFEM